MPLNVVSLVLPGKFSGDGMDVASELARAEDRTCAIVGAAVVEGCLLEALKRTLVPQPEKAINELFGVCGIFGAFGAKIELARLSGLAGADACHDLVKISKIRNTFAHRHDVRSFGHAEVVGKIETLRLPMVRCAEEAGFNKKKSPNAWVLVRNLKQALADPRDRFLLTIQVLSRGLMIAGAARMPPPLF